MNVTDIRRVFLLASFVTIVPIAAQGAVFVVPADGDNVIGGIEISSTEYRDTLSDLARVYDQGYNDMRLANPSVDPWLPGEGTEVVIPAFYVLPDSPYDGIVINVPEMRLYYYPKPARDGIRYVVTHPISIGRQEWTTPHGVAKVVAKTVNPAWYPPESIRKEHAERGDPLPRVVPPGPDNPLGKYALRLSIPGYLIHGTNKPTGIGMRATHGCIRLYPNDIERLFSEVRTGTKVTIVNRPFKIGRLGTDLYLEAHPHLEEDHDVFRDHHSQVMQLVVDDTSDRKVDLNWVALQQVLQERSGVPTVIGSVSADAEDVGQTMVSGAAR